jgi:Neuraminidase (sialidase)
LFGTPTHEIQTNLVLAPGPDNPGNSEGDFTQLKDGMVLFIYSHFTGSSRQLAAHLASRESTDGGKTWSDADRIVLRPESNEAPVLTSVSLLRLRDGRISLFYLAQKSPTDSQVFMRTSSDECATWSSPTTCTSGPGYFLIDNDCVIQLKSGRLLFPVARHESPPKGESDRGQVICFYSDDNGASWHSSKKPLEAMANSHSGLKNPVVVELKDGRLMMLMVIHLHPLYRSYSTDRGESWSPPEKTDLATPVSTASIKRIPSTGDLLLVWNDHSQIDPAAKNNRTPLVAAVSSDEGKTWPIRKTIYHDPNGTYCYTAIAFVGDRVLLGHCAGLSRGAAGLARPAITTFPIHWLYP